MSAYSYWKREDPTIIPKSGSQISGCRTLGRTACGHFHRLPTSIFITDLSTCPWERFLEEDRVLTRLAGSVVTKQTGTPSQEKLLTMNGGTILFWKSIAASNGGKAQPTMG